MNIKKVLSVVGAFAVMAGLLFSPSVRFASADSTIKVIAPNGGERWQKGTVHNILWSAPSSMANVSISVYTDTGCTDTTTSGKNICPERPTVLYTITSSTPNDGVFEWMVGQATSGTMPAGSYIITVAATDNSASASSSAAFSISDVSVIVPPVCPGNGAIVKYDGNPVVYIVENGMKRPYPSGKVFLSWNQSFSAVIIIASSCQFPDGRIVGFPDGKLIKGSGPAVYLVSQGTLRGFPSADIFFRLGYNFGQIMLVSDGDLSLQTMGSNMQ